ncbi:MAG: ankyrin repeat domain-containing protein [Planctomycetaceae bacterium]|nr:ankyrin repeat domain-containing protein [Planctomycetaceae bacterium]
MNKPLLAGGAILGALVFVVGGWLFFRGRDERLSDELFQLMVRKGAALNAPEPEEVRAFVASHPAVANRRFPKSDEFPLHRAAENGWTRTCEALLDGGADVNARDPMKLCPLYYAIYSDQFQKHPELARLLIDRGADLNALDSEGRSVLHYAAMNGSPKTVRFLAERGADVLAGRNGLTPRAALSAIKDLYVGGDVKGKLKPGKSLTPRDEEQREIYLYLLDREKQRKK